MQTAGWQKSSLARRVASTVVLTAAAVLVSAAAPPGVIPKGVPPILPLADVKPGMVLHGESVFGTQGLEPFEATVLAVMKDYMGPGEDLILVRMSGAAMDRYGVVSGMSGSPVYHDGKLVGAVSYRFGAFPKEPMAGVTPAESMLAILKDQRARATTKVAAAPAGQWRRPSGPAGEGTPIEAPLICGGCPEPVLAEYGPRLQAMGLTPVRGSAAGSAEAFPIFPGGPIASALVEGDVSVMALGTVTYVNGNDVLAFGHPFVGSGSAEMPMASAEVYTTIPSLNGSHKLGRAGKVVGALLDDRLTAIAGRVGAAARTVPFSVTLERPGELDARKVVSFRVVDDIGVGATLTDMAVSSAIMNRVGFESIGTVRVRGLVTLEDGTRIPMDQLFSGVPNRNPTFAAAGMVGDVMEVLWRNPFERVRFKSVELVVSHQEEPEVGTLVQATVAQTRVRAGQPFQLVINVQTHRHGLKRMQVEFPTQPRMEPGFYSIVVADRAQAQDIDREAAVLRVPRNLKQVVEDVKQQRRQDRLYAYLLDRVKGARVGGAPMAELPPSMLAILGDGQDGPAARKQPKRAIHVVGVEPGVMVSGSAEIAVEVMPPHDQ